MSAPNLFGHPAPSTLDTLRAAGATAAAAKLSVETMLPCAAAFEKTDGANDERRRKASPRDLDNEKAGFVRRGAQRRRAGSGPRSRGYVSPL